MIGLKEKLGHNHGSISGQPGNSNWPILIKEDWTYYIQNNDYFYPSSAGDIQFTYHPEDESKYS